MLLCNFILQSRKNVTKYFSYLNLLRFRSYSIVIKIIVKLFYTVITMREVAVLSGYLSRKGALYFYYN